MTTETMSIMERKYAKRFEMLDADGSGVIDHGDFAMLAKRLIDGLGVTPGSPKAERVVNGYQELWGTLQRMVDEDGDGEITKAEFISGMTRLAGDRPGFKRIIEPLARLNLSLCDADGDGTLNEMEFANLLHLFNATAMDEGAAIFHRLDTTGDGFLSLEEILDALCDFYISSDPDAPGNSLFGKV
jgi:Ca2+-binding EF-hand superfamily protein